MTTNNLINDSILIFHRSKQHSEKDIANQQAFLNAHKTALSSVQIINYTTGDNIAAGQIIDRIKLKAPEKLAVVFNSPSRNNCELQYDLYSFFMCLKSMGFLSFYFMDNEGKVYGEVGATEWKM
jgi:hypothetical protein